MPRPGKADSNVECDLLGLAFGDRKNTRPLGSVVAVAAISRLRLLQANEQPEIVNVKPSKPLMELLFAIVVDVAAMAGLAATPTRQAIAPMNDNLPTVFTVDP